MSTPVRSPLTEPAAVVVCAPEPITVQGIRMILGDCVDLKFLQSTDSLSVAAEILLQNRPTVLLLDRSLGPRVILDWLDHVKATYFHDSEIPTGIVIWGASGSEPEAVRFLRAGARGFLPKTADIGTVLTCLRAVAAGRVWMEDSKSDKHLELTAREREVLELIERGFRNKEIAKELGISEGTVKIHVMHVFRKTGLSRHALALKALREHISQSQSGLPPGPDPLAVRDPGDQTKDA